MFDESGIASGGYNENNLNNNKNKKIIRTQLINESVR